MSNLKKMTTNTKPNTSWAYIAETQVNREYLENNGQWLKDASLKDEHRLAVVRSKKQGKDAIDLVFAPESTPDANLIGNDDLPRVLAALAATTHGISPYAVRIADVEVKNISDKQAFIKACVQHALEGEASASFKVVKPRGMFKAVPIIHFILRDDIKAQYKKAKPLNKKLQDTKFFI